LQEEWPGTLKERRQSSGQGRRFDTVTQGVSGGGLEGELEAHLDEDEEPNRKNGKGRKKVKTSMGQVEIATPRDRNGTFEPELIGKRQRTLGVDLDRQIIALYARGASYGDI